MSQASGRGVVAAAAAAPEKAKETDAPTQAVRTIPSPEAQALRHAHPVLLLALFAIRFRALVADPVPTMWSSLPVVLAVQAAYTIVCLPPVGSQGAKVHRKPRPGEKKKSSLEGAGPNIAVVGSFFAFCFLPLPLLVLAGRLFLGRRPPLSGRRCSFKFSSGSGNASASVS